jgi:transposase
LSKVGAGGATVADVVRRHDIPRQHINKWRWQLRIRGFWPGAVSTTFLALDGPGTMSDATPLAPSGTSQTVLANGRVLRQTGGIGGADLTRLIRIVETA